MEQNLSALRKRRLDQVTALKELAACVPESPLLAPRRALPVFAMADVAKHATVDSCWVAINDKVYDLTQWLPKHPGGYNPILARAGTNCTDVFYAFHPAEVRSRINARQVGVLDKSADDELSRDYRALHEEMIQQGFNEVMPLWHYGRTLVICTLLAVAVGLVVYSPDKPWMQYLGALVLAGFWQQLAFVGHDLGHNSVTHDRQTDFLYGLAIGPLLTGISIGWWKNSHNTHHVATNHLEYAFTLVSCSLTPRTPPPPPPFSTCHSYLHLLVPPAIMFIVSSIVLLSLPYPLRPPGVMANECPSNMQLTIGTCSAGTQFGINPDISLISPLLHFLNVPCEQYAFCARRHDPDVQHMPFMAISERLASGKLWSTYHQKIMELDLLAKFLIPFQHYLYFPIMFFARFFLYVQSMIYLITKPAVEHRSKELVGMGLFFLWVATLASYVEGPWMRLGWVLLCHGAAGILHVQITLSHFCMDTHDNSKGDAIHKESFVRSQLATSLDIECPTWMDFFHGGLQFQVIHHLFPRVPRYRLRELRPRVLELCRKHGVKYHSCGFLEGNKRTIATLRAASKRSQYLHIPMG